jgi:hypothetical protein
MFMRLSQQRMLQVKRGTKNKNETEVQQLV